MREDDVRAALDLVREFILEQPNPDAASGLVADRLGIYWGRDDRWYIDAEPDGSVPWPLIDGGKALRNWSDRRRRRWARQTAAWLAQQRERPGDG